MIAGLPMCDRCMRTEADAVAANQQARSQRYTKDQDRDDKSGYRLACRPVAMVEGMLLDYVRSTGPVTYGMLLHHAVMRVAVPEREASHALLRLIVNGRLDYDPLTTAVTLAAPRLSWFRRLLNRFSGGIHPALVLIACVVTAAPACAIYAAIHNARLH